MFSDFFACCWDYLANEIPKTRYMTGGQVTVPLVVRTANGVPLALAAAEQVGADGISAEVIDLRSLIPLDMATVLASVRRTSPQPSMN
jgi:pyruvate/2-oxoglutarate/acetoin dehydrogenase E1 component